MARPKCKADSDLRFVFSTQSVEGRVGNIVSSSNLQPAAVAAYPAVELSMEMIKIYFVFLTEFLTTFALKKSEYWREVFPREY